MNEKLTLQDALKYPNAKIVRYAKGMSFKKISDYQNIIELIKRSWFLDIGDCKLILRSIESLTEEEKKEFEEKFLTMHEVTIKDLGGINETIAFLLDVLSFEKVISLINFFRSINIDIDGFIASGKAVAE